MTARSLVAIALLGATLVGCGPDAQSEPARINRSDVPFGLLDGRGVEERPTGRHSLVLYFVGVEELVPVEHPEERDPDAATALHRLLDGPTELELQQGLGTALPSRHAARLLGVEAGTARVDLAADFHDGTIPNQVTALAQIVLTLTELQAIERTSFRVDGRTAAVPRGDGSLTRAPVEREDYWALARS